MLAKLIDLVDIKHKNTLSIIDPFAGDGRLILWLLSIWHDRGLPQVRWELFLLDLDQAALLTAKKGLEKLRRSGISLTYRTKCTDSFEYFTRLESSFDIVVTNPPWEQLKPDRRELTELPAKARDAYVEEMKEYDQFLNQNYPRSTPKKKFSGWGTNLSRVGAELSIKLCKQGGLTGIVLPASFFADDQTAALRSLGV